MKILEAIHITDNRLINPTNAVTVCLAGAGGTGSNMLMALGKINETLLALDHPGLQVYLYDDDRVTPANKGRQLFAECEIGLHKAVALVNRANRFFGTNWKALTHKFNRANLHHSPHHGKANIYITCVDNVASRIEIAAILKGFRNESRHELNKPLYWLDLGNGRHTGQAVIATIDDIRQPESGQYRTVASLPMVTDEFRELLMQSETADDTPSCSLAEALTKQELFINPTLANLGASLLYTLFREGMLFNRGFFLNLRALRTEPIKVA